MAAEQWSLHAPFPDSYVPLLDSSAWPLPHCLFMCVSVARRSPVSCAASVEDEITLPAAAGGSLSTEWAHS